jgi:hypothetical protein
MDQNITGFMFLKNMFPKISYAKIKEGVFVGPHRRELIQDPKFEDQLSAVANAAWTSFKTLTNNFWEIISKKSIVI